MTYYVGSTPADSAGDLSIRYFYAIKRDDDGMLYFAKVDTLQDNDTIAVNNPGLTENDFTEFEYGVDFFDGRLAEDHSRPYSNLEWDQYRWSARNIFYYINDNGEFVVRINKSYDYPPGSAV